jgi:hypothetical protein
VKIVDHHLIKIRIFVRGFNIATEANFLILMVFVAKERKLTRVPKSILATGQPSTNRKSPRPDSITLLRLHLTKRKKCGAPHFVLLLSEPQIRRGLDPAGIDPRGSPDCPTIAEDGEGL